MPNVSGNAKKCGNVAQMCAQESAIVDATGPGIPYAKMEMGVYLLVCFITTGYKQHIGARFSLRVEF